MKKNFEILGVVILLSSSLLFNYVSFSGTAGRVLDTAGKPVAGVNVKLFYICRHTQIVDNSSHDLKKTEMITNKKGEFSFAPYTAGFLVRPFNYGCYKFLKAEKSGYCNWNIGGCAKFSNISIGSYVAKADITVYTYEEGFTDYQKKKIAEEKYQREHPGLRFLSNNYSTNDNKVYYEGKIMEGADARTFKVIENPNNLVDYAVDANHVYRRGQVLNIAINPGSFEVVFPNVIRDKDYVFFSRPDSEYNRVQNVDIGTLQDLGKNYYGDKNTVWFLGVEIAGADPYSFEVLDDMYTKDRMRVYSFGRVVEGVNPVNCTAENIKYCEKQ
jgi:hypothetical protein